MERGGKTRDVTVLRKQFLRKQYYDYDIKCLENAERHKMVYFISFPDFFIQRKH